MDILDTMIQNGVSLSRLVELTVQWDCVLRVGPVSPISLEDLQSVQGGVGIGDFFAWLGACTVRSLTLFVGRLA